MDIHCRICYPMEHETLWNSSTAGGTQTAGHRLTSGWPDLPIRGRDSECVHKLGSALGSELPGRWSKGSAVQACARTAASIVARAATGVVTAFKTRTSGGWLHNGSVDPTAYSETDSEALWDSLPPGPCLASDGEFTMDMAEAGTPGHAEKRASHRTLEEEAVARVKKKPKDLGPISYSSTKADSFSSPTCARPGRRSAIPRSLDTATGGTGFLPSPQSPSPHRASGLDFTSVSTATTLRGWRSSASCVTSSGTCADRWCCSGMAAPSTGASSSRSSFANTSDSMCIDFQPMPQSSIPMSLCGPKPRALCPMVHQRTSLSLDVGSAALSIASGALNGFFGPAFTLRNSLGPEWRYIHYLCEYQ